MKTEQNDRWIAGCQIVCIAGYNMAARKPAASISAENYGFGCVGGFGYEAYGIIRRNSRRHIRRGLV